MNEQPGAYLFIADGTNSGRVALSALTACRIGRGDGNTIVLADTMASRNHALIQASPDGVYYLSDLGSTNGTFVNGLRLSAAVRLRDQDCIQIGSLVFTFQQPGAAVESAAQTDHQRTDVLVQMRMVSVLVVDIRDLNVLGQHIGAERLGEVAGVLFREVGQALQIFGAWSQKCAGDTVMAVWLHSMGASQKEFLPALESIGAIRDIAARLTRRFQLGEPIRIGAGVNTGIAPTGNFASAGTSDYTALGDVVNKAFRMGIATRELGCDVLLGADSYGILRDNPAAEQLFRVRQVRLEGYAEEAVVYGTSLQALNGLIRSLIRPEDVAALNKTRRVR